MVTSVCSMAMAMAPSAVGMELRMASYHLPPLLPSAPKRSPACAPGPADEHRQPGGRAAKKRSATGRAIAEGTIKEIFPRPGHDHCLSIAMLQRIEIIGAELPMLSKPLKLTEKPYLPGTCQVKLPPVSTNYCDFYLTHHYSSFYPSLTQYA